MKNKTKILIIGSGIGGLGSACWAKKYKQDFMVIDSCKELPLNLHNGVHYLHTIPDLPFDVQLKKITLTDGIMYNGKIYNEPNLKFALQYSEKVREIQHPSSIMEIGKTKFVYIPKTNCMNTFLEDCYNFADPKNFYFGYSLYNLDTKKQIARFTHKESGLECEIKYKHLIITIPLSLLEKIANIEFPESIKFDSAPIHTVNYKVDKIVPNWMINLYVPELNIPFYRASILNGICSVESIKKMNEHEIHTVIDNLSIFHISDKDIDQFEWNTGKITSIDIDNRELIVNVLKPLNIYPIGRFGLWNRKLLMDTTVKQAKLVVEHTLGEKWKNVNKMLIR